jgi:putative intracellular protease/amidase
LRIKLSDTAAGVTGVRVAILADNGFEQDELTMPKKALDEAGAETKIVSPQKEVIKGWKSKKWGDKLQVDVPLDQANPDSFDALLLPGGVVNADSADAARGRAVRQVLLYDRQAGGGHMPRTWGDNRSGGDSQSADDFVAVARD